MEKITAFKATISVIADIKISRMVVQGRNHKYW